MKRLTLTLALLFIFAAPLVKTAAGRKPPAQVSAGTSVYVIGVSAQLNGNVAIAYHASRTGSAAQTNTVFLSGDDVATLPIGINEAIMTHARNSLGISDAETVTLYGGAVAQQRVMPGP